MKLFIVKTLCSIVSLLFLARAVTPIPKYLEIATPNHFQILVATDLHCNKQDNLDQQDFTDIAKIIANYKPDLLVLDGDLTSDLGLSGLSWVVDRVAQLGIPWVFARGNHDGPQNDFSACHAYLSSAANSLYAGTNANPNYVLSIRNKGVSTNLWNLFIIDDGSYTPNMGFKQAQIDWLNSTVASIGSNPPPAFVFAHIPLQQYKDVWDSGHCVGVHGEAVCYEAGGLRTAFTAMVNSHQIRGMWCGHDHDNNYWGTLNGIMLCYSRHMCHRPQSEIYGNLKSGCQLITVNAASQTFTTKAVFADDPVAVNQKASVKKLVPLCHVWFAGTQLRISTGSRLEDFRLLDLRGRTVFRLAIVNAQYQAVLAVPTGIYTAAYRAAIGGDHYSQVYKTQ